MTTTTTSPWTNAVERHRGLRFLDASLRGAGQVMLQNHPLTGLLFLAGIVWAAVAAGQIAIAVGAVAALLVSTLTAVVLRVDQPLLRQGLYGFNGLLVGIGMATFLRNTPLLWVYLVIGAALSTLVMLALTNLLRAWSLPALTFPFVLTTWLVLLAAYQFAHLSSVARGPPALPRGSNPVAAHAALTAGFLLTGWLTGVSQVFLLNNIVTALIFVVALAISSRWAAFFALVGSAVGLLVALLFGANAASIGSGLYGFSAVLTAIALGGTFYAPSLTVALYTIAGVLATIVAQAALNTALLPLGIPTLTAPFVLATWLFLLPKLPFAPAKA